MTARKLFAGYARCFVTGNPVGTDTWQVGHPCDCEACQDYIANSRVGVLLEVGSRRVIVNRPTPSKEQT